jgi:hypothetical protein
MTQIIDEALRIEGSIAKIGNDGVQIEVRGPDGSSIFGPKWIGTTELIQSGAGEFTQKVTVIKPGQYDVYFKDQKGYIGVKTFTVTAPAAAPTTVRTTAPVTSRPPTTVPTPLPTTTKSPMSLLPIVAALSILGIMSVVLMKKR